MSCIGTSLFSRSLCFWTPCGSKFCWRCLLLLSSWKTLLLYTGCPGGNVPDIGRMFLKLKYTDITKNTYIRSWRVTKIMGREKCGLLAVLRTIPDSHDVLLVHCACPSFSLHSAQARSRWDCTSKVFGTLRTTTTLVRVFMYFNWMVLCHSDVN